jgi:riboflavin biosynthesis pyrimidine reductase
MNPRLTRVLPSPTVTTSVRTAYDVERTPHPDRPWIGLCMVSSLDGSVAVDGGSGGLGNANDLDVLLTLRDLADIVIVGAGTVRDEGYGAPRKAGQRIGVATNRGRVDLSTDLFTSGAGFLLAPESADIDESAVEVLRAGHERLDLSAAMHRLDEVMPGAAYIQVEGGPTLNAALHDADLIDELDLSISPRMVGGGGPRLVVGSDEADRRFDLAHLLVDDEGFVFSRWIRRRPSAGTN